MILPSSAGSESSGLFSVLSGVFTAEEVDRAGDNVSIEITTVDVQQKLLEQVHSQTMEHSECRGFYCGCTKEQTFILYSTIFII